MERIQVKLYSQLDGRTIVDCIAEIENGQLVSRPLSDAQDATGVYNWPHDDLEMGILTRAVQGLTSLDVSQSGRDGRTGTEYRTFPIID